MLPPPTLSFTIPSIYDDLVLCCRVYHPICLVPTKISQIQEWRKRAAIVAHPYAPLGGCYDDPIVETVASTILKQGYIVGTFNFRGAGTSKGRTSWQSKAEQNDYISFIGFMIYYLHLLSPPSLNLLEQPKFTHSNPNLHELSPIPSQAVAPRHDTDFLSPTTTSLIPHSDMPSIPPPRLLLAGYSYGAMITSSLPPILNSLIQPFQSPPVGSAHAEIRLRADCLAGQQNWLMNTRVARLLSQMHSHGRSLQIEDQILSNAKVRKPSGGVRMGGEEDLRRASHESYRSRSSFTIETPEMVRKSVDRVRSIARSGQVAVGRASSHESFASSSKKKGSESDNSIEHLAPDDVGFKTVEHVIKPIQGVGDGLETAYLLVSPLHGWVSTLATMWSSRSVKEKEIEPDMKFIVHPTLALFGDDDVFVSVKRLRAWVEKLKGAKIEDKTFQFQYREVSGAGHFWHDHRAIQILREEVKGFVALL
ncbi:hypothetical protein D0Z07_8459 [Hyphodiscus hymeniophilus]|uniref:Uncharacterized protein n=1 Tax=Hyphodiscus hymeniophilus TaxID=353542 RepID=A0A9P6SPK6_9HELO|nr:hypothetical protein D0Z07_8459 [Hyphodiscus hymeniophilus]